MKSIILQEGEEIPNDFSFPCIGKSLEAGGSRDAHTMVRFFL